MRYGKFYKNKFVIANIFLYPLMSYLILSLRNDYACLLLLNIIIVNGIKSLVLYVL